MRATGFVGLGNMGGVLAANLVASGHSVVAFDLAGPSLTPPGASFADSVATVARQAEVVVLSLPDGVASGQVAKELAGVAGHAVSHVVDTSTIGITAARSNARVLAAAGIGYVDAPVSGGVAGARARTLTVMYAGPDDDCARVEPVLAGLSNRRVRVGDAAGLAQAMKLANNFLAATTLAATSEAIAFGLSAGLDMGAMLEVLNGASGQSAATSDKFPRQVLTGSYAAGFANTLMAKDVRLYLDSVRDLAGPAEIGDLIGSLWSRFAADEPGADFTRVFPYIQGT
jgi:3-hydroxyisobutyrate dehydrogenase-like beta-hydroxyacid dehydrogenase